jgi:two-component system response regulator MprA
VAHVLLVDDEPVLRMALRQYLEFAGHTVDEASDGDDALASIRRDPPDIVISDVLMPRRDGMSLCRELRGDPVYAALPFLFITARNTHADLLDEMQRIGDGCVVKPFEPDHLLDAIDRAVNGSSKRNA